jgi:DNA-directed RNA polymerase subunit RPC12/RpoP
MSETIKCACSKCGAKYRLPVEAQGRTARCKRCGEKFVIPRAQSLEDSILTWLSMPEEDELEQSVPAPRVISMPAKPEQADPAAAEAAKRRGPIRLKDTGAGPKTESA